MKHPEEALEPRNFYIQNTRLKKKRQVIDFITRKLGLKIILQKQLIMGEKSNCIVSGGLFGLSIIFFNFNK